MYCQRCKIVRKPNTVHCVSCDVCVEGALLVCKICVIDYDHHCPWTGKCVARGNLALFYVFSISTMILILFLTMTCPLC